MLLKFVSHFLLVWNETPRFIPSSPVIWSQNWTWRKCRGHLHRRSLMPTQIFTPVPILIILIIPIIKAQHRFDARIMVGNIAANICIRQSRIPVFCRIFEPTHQSQKCAKEKSRDVLSSPRIIIGLYLLGCRLLGWGIIVLRWRLGASNVAVAAGKKSARAKVHSDDSDEVAHSNVVPWHVLSSLRFFGKGGGMVGYGSLIWLMIEI